MKTAQATNGIPNNAQKHIRAVRTPKQIAKRVAQYVVLGACAVFGSYFMTGCGGGGSSIGATAQITSKQTTPKDEVKDAKMYSPDPADPAHMEKYLLPNKMLYVYKEDCPTCVKEQKYAPNPLGGYAVAVTDASILQPENPALTQKTITIDIFDKNTGDQIASKPFIVGSAADGLITLTPDVTGGATATLFVKVTDATFVKTTDPDTQADVWVFQKATYDMFLGDPSNDPTIAARPQTYRDYVANLPGNKVRKNDYLKPQGGFANQKPLPQGPIRFC